MYRQLATGLKTRGHTGAEIPCTCLGRLDTTAAAPVVASFIVFAEDSIFQLTIGVTSPPALSEQVPT